MDPNGLTPNTSPLPSGADVTCDSRCVQTPLAATRTTVVLVNRYEAASKALLLNAGISGRAEDLGGYGKLFVDPVNSSSLETNANQLVFGRRGSGKTLLFGALNERINSRFPVEPFVAFYYTATEFRSSAEYGGVHPTVKEKTHAYFHSFIEKLSNDMLDLADRVFKKPTLLSALGLVGDSERARRERLVDRVLRLVEAARIGADSPLPTSLTQSREHLRSLSSERKRDVGVQASSEGIKFSGEVRGDRANRIETVDKILYGPRRAFDPSTIRRLLVEIIETLGLTYVVILLDEWMSLSECQTEFAERLRQCLFGEERLAVKIAADQYQGQFNNAGTGHNFRGLEIGADVFIEADLDQPFRDMRASFPLYTDVLYRRLCFLFPPLEESFGPPPLTNPTMFVETIFENRHAFEEVCRGAQGLCRDFHAILQDCAKRVNWNVASTKIDFETVQSVLVGRTDETYDRVLKSVDSNPLLVNIIIPHVRDSGSRYFLVENRETRFSHIVDDLLSKRFIHALPLSEMHPTLKASHRLFEIDYGIYLDLMQARAFSRPGDGAAKGGSEALPKTITSTNVARYALDLGPFERLLGVAPKRCRHCGVEFAASERAFATKRLCPNCFEVQDE